MIVSRPEDVASDHHVVEAKLGLRPRRSFGGQQKRQARYNTAYLKNERITEEYGLALSNRFQVLQQLDTAGFNKHWSPIKEDYTQTWASRSRSTNSGSQWKQWKLSRDGKRQKPE